MVISMKCNHMFLNMYREDSKLNYMAFSSLQVELLIASIFDQDSCITNVVFFMHIDVRNHWHQ
jgi:hypothetical protein